MDFEAHCAYLFLSFLLRSERRLDGSQWLCEIPWSVLISPRSHCFLKVGGLKYSKGR
jgi:hypothetical protein